MYTGNPPQDEEKTGLNTLNTSDRKAHHADRLILLQFKLIICN
jgi:hypothetical protein